MSNLYFDKDFDRGIGYKLQFVSGVQTEINDIISGVNSVNNGTLQALDRFASKVSTLRGKMASAVDNTLTANTLSGNSNNQFFVQNVPVLNSDNIVVENSSISLIPEIKESHHILSIEVSTNGSVGNTVDFNEKRYSNKDLITTSTRVEFEKINESVSASMSINLGSVKVVNCISLSFHEFGIRAPQVSSVEISSDGVLYTPVPISLVSIGESTLLLLKDYSASSIRVNLFQDDGYLSNNTRRFAIGVSNLKVGISTCSESGEIIFGPMHSSREIIKASIGCDIPNDGYSSSILTFELSEDGKRWEKISPAYIKSNDRKFIDYNTISNDSIKTAGEVKSLYLKVSMSGDKVQRKYSNSSTYNKHSQTISTSFPVVNIPFDLSQEYVVGESTGVDFGGRVSLREWRDDTSSIDRITSIKEGGHYLIKEISSLGSVSKATVRYISPRCGLVRDEDYSVATPADTDIYSTRFHKSSSPVIRPVRVTEDIPVVLPFEEAAGIYTLSDGDISRRIDLSSGYFSSCYQWAYKKHTKDVRLISPVGELLHIFPSGVNISLLDFFTTPDIVSSKNSPIDIHMNKEFPHIALGFNEFTIIDGKIRSNSDTAIVDAYILYLTEIKHSSEFGIDGVLFKSNNVSMSRVTQNLNEFDGKRIAKLLKSSIVKGSVRFDYSKSSMFTFANEVDFINGVDEFSTGNRVEVNIPKSENSFSLGYLVNHFSEIKFIGHSSIFSNRVFDKSELISVGDYMLRDDGNETFVDLPTNTMTHDIINTVAIIDIPLESVGNGAFSIDYSNGIIYSESLIDGNISIVYDYSNIFLSGKEIKKMDKDSYTISGRQLSVKSPSDEMSISITSKISEVYNLDIHRSPKLSNLIINTVIV